MNRKPVADLTKTIAESNENKKSSSFLKKFIKVILILLIFISVLVALLIGSVIFFWDEKEIIDNVNKYEKILGESGKYKDNYFGYNNIFPDTLPASASVEKFYYEYYNPFDPNYLGYLVYTCNDEDYKAEYERMAKVDSSENYLVYGATEFSYELCAVKADDSGYIYAMTDSENNCFIYVELEFCNYFTDIDYKSIIDKNHLPKGFDAEIGNDKRKEFEKGISRKQP